MQYIHIYYILDLIQNKITEQESLIEDSLLQYDSPPCDSELQMLAKDVTMSEGEWRIFVSRAIGQSWEDIVTNYNDTSISSSWYCTGINLNVDGSNDAQWKKQMKMKFDGRDIKQNQDPKSWDYVHQRTFSTVFNKDTEVPPLKNISDQKSTSSNSRIKPSKSVVPINQSSDTKNESLRTKMYSISKTETPIATFDRVGFVGESNKTSNPQQASSISSSSSSSSNTLSGTSVNSESASSSSSSSNTMIIQSANHSISSFRYVGMENVYKATCYQLSFIQGAALIPEWRQSCNMLEAMRYDGRKYAEHKHNKEDHGFISRQTWNKYIKVIRTLNALLHFINNPQTINYSTALSFESETKTVVISPREFVQSLPPPYNSKYQQDVHEFRVKIFDIIQKIKDNAQDIPSTVTSLYKFKSKTRTLCNVCSNSRNIIETHITLEVC